MNPQVSRCQNVTGEEQINSSRKNEEAKQKQKLCPAVDVSGGKSKVHCCKDQYFLYINISDNTSSTLF